MPQIYPGPLGSYLTKHGFVMQHKINKHGYYVSWKGPCWEGLLEEKPDSKIESNELVIKGTSK